MKRIAIATVLLALATLGACASEAVTETSAETTAAPVASEEPGLQPADEPGEEPAVDAESSASTEVETFTMPNLVGKNLQAAQDELQARGSYILSQDDATGQGRFQVLDSNWKVCSQDRKAGQEFDLAEMVNLTAVKLNETCP
ncbi:MAG: hypothetical protein JWP56_481 [Aeromicrobium sp.]|nr:hypothetical protein [Aeromicrobium sp.]